MKKCPYCAEEIQDGAIKCRFCGESLTKKRNCLVGCLIGLVISILLLILFVVLSSLILRLFFNRIYFGVYQFPPYYHHPPFSGGGIQGILREFAEAFRGLWERLLDFLNIGGSQIKQITF